MANVQPNRFYAVFKISEETNCYRGGDKFHLLQNFIEFGSLCGERRESEKADIRLHNKGALQSDPRGKHKTRDGGVPPVGVEEKETLAKTSSGATGPAERICAAREFEKRNKFIQIRGQICC
jgi:hypothetical protein